MRLTTADVDRYGPLYDCHPPCRDGLTVISGQNEAGKTLYLEALLQLLEPDVEAVMDPPPRISEPPTGRVVIEHGGDQYECDGERTVGDVTAIEPDHLQSVFVVRDSDLQLPDEQAYFTSLIEKLGDIHTTEINRIKSELKDRGRLTAQRLKISTDQRYHDAGAVRETAETLAAEIREYVETIDAEGLDELEARRLRLARRRRDVADRLREQEEARTVDEYAQLSDRLDTYRETSERLDELTAFDRNTFDELRAVRNDLERDLDDLEDLDGEIEETATTVEETADRLGDLEDEHAALEQRAAAVSKARDALRTFRDRQAAAAGADRRSGLAKLATVAGLLAAGGAGIAGAITGSMAAIALGAVLLLVAVIGGLVFYRATRRLAAVESARATALQAARDAGFEVEAVDEVATGVESFERDLETVRTRVTRTEQDHERARDDLAELRAEKSELRARITDQEETVESGLEEAGVETIETFEERVDRREDLRRRQETARQSLVDRFGDPDGEYPDGEDPDGEDPDGEDPDGEDPDGEDPEANARSWESDLEALVQDVDLASVDADDYDAADRRRLENELEELERELRELESTLEAHDDRLDEFDRRAREVDTRPFIDRTVALDSRSRDGLDVLADDLEAVVRRIETDAEVSRKTLELFDRIETREERKLVDLFDPDGPASSTFARLTGDRYTEVAYDADSHDLVVTRRDGRTFSPGDLSHGTTDQLYFATRVSLARQLLGEERGFFLLDDPFLAADSDRLRRGFETLQDLADSGWQIFYLTAKREVSERMVDTFDLDRVEMNAPSLGV